MSAALLVLEVWLARVGRQQALDAVCEAMDADIEDAATGLSINGTQDANLPSGVTP